MIRIKKIYYYYFLNIFLVFILFNNYSSFFFLRKSQFIFNQITTLNICSFILKNNFQNSNWNIYSKCPLSFFLFLFALIILDVKLPLWLLAIKVWKHLCMSFHVFDRFQFFLCYLRYDRKSNISFFLTFFFQGNPIKNL